MSQFLFFNSDNLDGVSEELQNISSSNQQKPVNLVNSNDILSYDFVRASNEASCSQTHNINIELGGNFGVQ